jgi:hypothetical protein
MLDTHSSVFPVQYGLLQQTLAEPPQGWTPPPVMVLVPLLPVPAVMYSLVEVHNGSASSRHAVISAHYPRLADATCQSIRDALAEVWPRVAASFVVGLTHESGKVACEVLSEHDPVVTVAAVAGAMRSGILDDIHTVTVTHGGRTYVATPEWSNGHSKVSIAEGAG